MLKALYKRIKYALPWYNLYNDTLENEGFVLNYYDKCTANKMINDKPCTIQLYVDENKVTHVSEGVIAGVINTTRNILES